MLPRRSTGPCPRRTGAAALSRRIFVSLCPGAVRGLALTAGTDFSHGGGAAPVSPRCRPGAAAYFSPGAGRGLFVPAGGCRLFLPRRRPGGWFFPAGAYFLSSSGEKVSKRRRQRGAFYRDAPLWTLPPKRQLHSLGTMSLIYTLCCHFAAAVRRRVLASSVSFTSAGAAKAHLTPLLVLFDPDPLRWARDRETGDGEWVVLGSSVSPTPSFVFRSPVLPSCPGDPRGPAGPLGRAKGILKGKPLRNGFLLSAPLPTSPAWGKGAAGGITASRPAPGAGKKGNHTHPLPGGYFPELRYFANAVIMY